MNKYKEQQIYMELKKDLQDNMHGRKEQNIKYFEIPCALVIKNIFVTLDISACKVFSGVFCQTSFGT